MSSGLRAAGLAWTLSGFALAQSGDDTIVLVPEGAELPDVVTRLIDLPQLDDGEYIPAPRGVENSAKGLAVANEARENGRAFGETMAAQAQENRENNARGARPDLANLRPDAVPDDGSSPTLPRTPGLPDRAEPPVAPPAQP